MDYHAVRRKFEPQLESVKLVLLAESPPAANGNGEFRYFYDANTRTGDNLFKATMAALRIQWDNDKVKGLQELQRRGVLLLDVSYTPVNNLPEEERGATLERGYRRELLKLLSKLPARVPIAIVMIAIYKCFAYRLREDGFNVIHTRIQFPNRPKYESMFIHALKSITVKYNI